MSTCVEEEAGGQVAVTTQASGHTGEPIIFVGYGPIELLSQCVTDPRAGRNEGVDPRQMFRRDRDVQGAQVIV